MRTQVCSRGLLDFTYLCDCPPPSTNLCIENSTEGSGSTGVADDTLGLAAAMIEEARQTEYDFPLGISGLVRPGKALIIEKPIYEPFAVLTSPELSRPLAGLIPLWWLNAGPPVELDPFECSLLAAEGWQPLQFYAVLRRKSGRVPTINLLCPLVLNPFTRKGLCVARAGPAEFENLPVTAVTAPYRSKIRLHAAG